MDKVLFGPVNNYKKLADRVFAEQKKRIQSVLPMAKIHHVGSTVIPGSITKGDLDINIRVNKKEFKPAIEKLQSLYKINQSDNWTESFASFKDDNSFEIRLGVQLTVINSKLDHFLKARDILIENPKLIKEYNAMKDDYQNKDMELYRKAKSEFFKKLLKQ